MGTELDQARLIAERIARRVSEGTSSNLNPSNNNPEVSTELAVVRATLSQLQRKLTQLEARVRSESVPGFGIAGTGSGTVVSNQPRTPASLPPTYSPWLGGVNAGTLHPSQERFGVEEAVVTELVDYFQKEKTCGIEPGGKPCDHCDMCSSRGF
jgi:hypothetical protein